MDLTDHQVGVQKLVDGGAADDRRIHDFVFVLLLKAPLEVLIHCGAN